MKKLQSDQLSQAAGFIREGGIVIVPTSRWYMICCDAFNQAACQHVFDAKQRPTNKQLLLTPPTIDQAKKAFDVSEPAERLIKAFWPGDLFLQLNWKEDQRHVAHDFIGDETALVNVPCGIFGQLCERYGEPIASTAASISVGALDHENDKGPCITVGEVEDFVAQSGLNASAIIDGGICPEFHHGTIVDCSTVGQKPQLTREGTVHKRALNAALEGMDVRF